MPKDHPIKKSAREYPALLIGSCLIVILIAVLGWLFISRASFTIGHTRSRFLIQSISKLSGSQNVNTNAIFMNVGWVDPTGQITRGRAYGLRIGSHMFELDTYYAP
ncbi:hypothetical protein [Pedosphaera parvula]|uniref:Uncharacterized protein n=1 Tax=Pedosphaera parvula (strain Ellin514) TaxID=320771 RepID=B9XC66_PEDPL|nr:hypothetical protein [Pedosphaera parvula]EEF62534.1 hypothetical protein Cflav_PD5169 [Pedosphaera parvula Ellin514]